MGYNLGIGEFEVEVDKENRYCHLTVDAPEVVKDAPLNSSDDRSNWIYPSYTVWSNFCNQVGIAHVFWNYRYEGDTKIYLNRNDYPCSPLLDDHPGCAALTEWHLEEFKKARERYVPRSEEEERDYVKARLDWLVFWTEWALKNCKYPSFANS